MALAHDKENGLYSIRYNQEFSPEYSQTKIDKAERRLKVKKELLEDIQNEVRLLELDAYNIYREEVAYYFILPNMIDKAKQWLAMLNDPKIKIDKRKKYEEKNVYEYITHKLEELLGQSDIKITKFSQMGYEHFADIIGFECNGHYFHLTIPIIQRISLKDYQDNGAYEFQLRLHVKEGESMYGLIGITFNENELKDFMNKFLEEQNTETEGDISK